MVLLFVGGTTGTVGVGNNRASNYGIYIRNIQGKWREKILLPIIHFRLLH